MANRNKFCLEAKQEKGLNMSIGFSAREFIGDLSRSSSCKTVVLNLEQFAPASPNLWAFGNLGTFLAITTWDEDMLLASKGKGQGCC